MSAFLDEIAEWYANVPPDFAFLLGLPFFVAAVGLLGPAIRNRLKSGSRERRAGSAAAKNRRHAG